MGQIINFNIKFHFTVRGILFKYIKKVIFSKTWYFSGTFDQIWILWLIFIPKLFHKVLQTFYNFSRLGNHLNFMIFPGFQWPHEPCVNDQKVISYISHACDWCYQRYDDLTILHNRFSKWFARYQHKMTWLIILKWKKQSAWLYLIILGSMSYEHKIFTRQDLLLIKVKLPPPKVILLLKLSVGVPAGPWKFDVFSNQFFFSQLPTN